jgi:glycosyltransferase involved in cell wall biosynthesis
MQITVAICTWNRAKLLDQTLAAICKLEVPTGVEWEILIVNNNCTDDTDEVIASYSTRIPVRIAFEARPGVSHARNAAVREAKGDYILWTDDDVLVYPDWICSYCEAIRSHPEAGFFGGPIGPWFEGIQPDWLTRCFSQVSYAYAAIDLGEKPFLLSKKKQPFGANFAVRMKEQMVFHYDPSLGRKRGNSIGGEESAVFNAMLDAGIEGWWVPDARVNHYISRERQTIKYLRNYFIGIGQTLSVMEPDISSVRLFGKPRYLWRKAFESEALFRLHRLFSNPETWIEYLISACIAWGQLGCVKGAYI